MLPVLTFAQAISDVNFNYLYSPKYISFDLKAVRLSDHWKVFYKLQVIDTILQLNEFSISWEIRKNLTDKNGTTLTPEEIQLRALDTDKYKKVGDCSLTISSEPQIILVKVDHKLLDSPLIFYKILEPKFPVNAWLKSTDGEIIFESYINPDQSVAIGGDQNGDTLTVSYYNDFFPTATPPFSEVQAKVSKAIATDSTFTITEGQLLTFNKRGLYLVQKDSMHAQALSFRVEDAYPKFIHLQDLHRPLVYVCTRPEFEKLNQAGGDKKKFDKVVLGITQDAGRAKSFMRNYFRRAESANMYFTSYKEGWKTDRGMLCLIYGPPEKVSRYIDREVWLYGKVSFTFMKTGTLFDPENYVLMRSNRYKVVWYEKVDLIRNSRF